MDVTPISKQDMFQSKPKSDSASQKNVAVKSAAQDFTNPSEAETEIADPVKRAEQAIGPFFMDSNYPAGRFSIDKDDDSGRYVYRLIHRETKEVLKQFPGDYVLRRVAFYRELQGIAVNDKV